MNANNYFLLLTSSFFIILTAFLFEFLYSVQPTELIDELFHVNQAQTYCNGSFDKWNQKITTLPGLYVISVGALKLWSLITGTFICSIYSLRVINLVFAACNFFVIFQINELIHPKETSLKLILSTFNISTFPILFFLSFFYYTEALSTLLVLSMYLFHLWSRFWTASILGGLAVFTRQTNIVWISLMLFDYFDIFINKANISGYTKGCQLADHKTVNTLDCTLKKMLQLYSRIWYNPLGGMKLLLGLVWPCCGYIIVIISFITFVISNGGLVVGDKSAHQAEINLPQLFYFSFFVIAFALPYFIVRIKSFLKFVLQHKLFSALCMLLFVIITRYNTVVHPYLLADNRHYVFYLWKAFYERRVMPKYLLSPVYFFGLYSIISHLKNKSFLFLLGYFVSLVVSIVPQKLLEYRYYILPFMVFRININNLSWLQLSAELLFFLVINVMSIYIFASKEFYWADSKEIQRIIW